MNIFTSSHSTIFALATASGRAAVAIMRISGPQTLSILEKLCNSVPKVRQASVRQLWRRGDQDELLDQALVIWFKGSNSYTGEDSAELHLHAGPAVIDAVADALVYYGARPAQAGEFSKRAFLNGKVDLLQAEGISDLVEAETQAQRRQALEQTEGSLSIVYQGWAQKLREVLAFQEALIDFPDEDLPEEVEENLKNTINNLHQEMKNHLNDAGRGERLRRGLVFAILGAPNAGKSSLLNLLADRDAAIVTEQAGTTRDAIEVRVVLGDVPVTLVDTAGLRETEDLIEAEGIKRAQKIGREADCVLCLTDASVDVSEPEVECDFWIRTKKDLNVSRETLERNNNKKLYISVKTGEGIDYLKQVLAEKAKFLTARQGPPPLTRVRHRLGIEECVQHLEEAQRLDWPELRGEELRLAMQSLGRLTGTIGVEDLLDTIFSQFCIGK
ncbi:tRNA U34 5-carboxymethylaminomethyl modifying GTPase MnmE/TrmE (MnmE) [Commensalibacter communis]|uniref:tRNA modification GTPase MnmE n=1 Tax=Commensalibacter communis TaxID=2972786 RepID=A0A9W4X9M8_9PROT|nr:tRNA uridine-5-carboxymethylaminomethyl(34) synthesis GTPase MnmE [Commensalibacter communis]CAI3940094.1 tRNA U34 5-carboxymethylaminomethyl modifying GTPase MnmE/TrmE (MnmE) [Commensalibacter communis]CAI3940244.1 tRNA U34 5-carboxymethylaminomethyl modifying GTPase MnmE/TrmE (MnmE) [Commensalibacter communis]CAI3943231.1 tRNA U34 5-carboxymethylaminomethyl modifying GTPase MnmE/TrmE (MnmE) [Commensalibacter communis]CAI3946545.1 tRNA U34 5-carboxymethylaminomethyl modifying GTPase MnmE/Tr